VKQVTKAQEVLYAVVGAGDYAAEKVTGVRSLVDRKANQKRYRDFIKRGRSVSTKVKNSKPVKEVASQTEPARKQVEDAAKSVGKAFGVNVVSWPSKRRTASRPAATRKTTRKTTAKKSTAKAS
jgi:hypothetical protein